tara:strand:+ start:704 stop:1570 length:867 start_codon:yes stop_codon:yes gene_type:complete
MRIHIIYNILILVFFLNYLHGIGLQGLVIPQNSSSLSTSGTGIAANIDASLNPAMKVPNSSYLQYSQNTWLGEIQGNHMLFRWDSKVPKEISIKTWNATELELWGDYPDDRPLGTFSVHYISTAFNISHNLNTPYQFGLRIQTNYSQLFTESQSVITMDIGMKIPFNNFIKFGSVIRNFGYKMNNSLRSDIPLEYGLGTEIILPIIKGSILNDLIYNNINEIESRYALKTNYKVLNLFLGGSSSNKRKAQSFGFSLKHHKWEIFSSFYFHKKSSILGTPLFIDLRRYL